MQDINTVSAFHEYESKPESVHISADDQDF